MAGWIRTANANWRGQIIFGCFDYISNHNYLGTEQAQRVGRLLLTHSFVVAWQQAISSRLSGESCSKPVEGESCNRKVATPKLPGAERVMGKNPEGPGLIPEKSQQALNIEH
jgi:hypothetical protein